MNRKGGELPMANLIPWRGLRELDRFRSEMDDLFERFFDWRPSFRFMEKSEWTPSLDLSETENELIVRAEIPGMKKEEIDIHLEGRLLTIQGEKKQKYEEKTENLHRVECRYGAFSRTLDLPADVDSEKVQATYKRGVLTLILPKTEKRTAKKIEITGA